MTDGGLGGALELEVCAGVVHVAWPDNRNNLSSNDVFYTRSVDGGQTFLPTDLQLNASGVGVGDVTGIGFHMSCAAPLVVVGWAETPSGGGLDVHGIVSTNDGLSFGPDQALDLAPPGSLSPFLSLGTTADPDSGSAAVAWSDTRFGFGALAELFVATSADSGQNWNEVQVSNGAIGGLTPQTGTALVPDGRTWMTFAYSGSSDGRISAVQSTDGGTSWGPPLELEPSPIAGGIATGSFAINNLYGNRIHTWSRGSFFGASTIRVGGYRVPTLDLVQDFVARSLHFELTEFGDAPLGVVLLSRGLGSFPVGFGDVRDLGLAFDNILIQSLGLIFGPLGAELIHGSGATEELPALLPPGVALFATAVSFDTATGAIVIEEIADALPL